MLVESFKAERTAGSHEFRLDFHAHKGVVSKRMVANNTLYGSI